MTNRFHKLFGNLLEKLMVTLHPQAQDQGCVQTLDQVDHLLLQIFHLIFSLTPLRHVTGLTFTFGTANKFELT